MKKTVTSLSFSAKRVLGRLAFAALFISFFQAVSFSQSNSIKEEIGDLSSKVWRDPVGIDVAIADENARLTTILGQPDLQPQDRSLFLCYQRLLNFVQTATQAGKPVDEAIVGGFEQVLAEAPHDVDLKHLPDGALSMFIPGVVELLTAVPVPAILSGQ